MTPEQLATALQRECDWRDAIADRLRSRKQASGLSLVQIVRLTGVPKTSVCHIMQGSYADRKHWPNAARLFQMMEWLGMSLGDAEATTDSEVSTFHDVEVAISRLDVSVLERRLLSAGVFHLHEQLGYGQIARSQHDSELSESLGSVQGDSRR